MPGVVTVGKGDEGIAEREEDRREREERKQRNESRKEKKWREAYLKRSGGGKQWKEKDMKMNRQRKRRER
jgi:hypothetical protein